MSRAGFRRKFRRALRSAPLFRCNLPGRRCNVGVHAARQSHAGHLDPRTVQSDAAVVHLALGQPHGKLRGVGRGPHPKGRIGHRNPPYGDLPRQGRRAVGPLLRGLPDLQADRRVPVRQRDPEDIGRPGLQIDPGEIHPEPSGRKTHVRSRDGIAVTGREIPEFEIADHRPAAKQRQQGDVERQPSAADKRVPALSQQHVVRRQAERKSEPDAADRKFHAERPGDGPFRPDAHDVLHRRDIERCGNQDQRRDEAQQRAERIFDDFSPVHFSRRRPEASTFRDRPSKTTASYENSGSCPKAFRHIRPDSRHLSFFLPAGCPGTAETARFSLAVRPFRKGPRHDGNARIAAASPQRRQSAPPRHAKKSRPGRRKYPGKSVPSNRNSALSTTICSPCATNATAAAAEPVRNGVPRSASA